MGLLLTTLFLPLIGAAGVMFIGKQHTKAIERFSLILSIATFIVSVILFLQFDSSNPGFQFVLDIPWIASIDAGFRIGADGMTMLLVVLTTFIMPIAILSSFDTIHKRQKEYYIMVLLLQFGMTGVFLALDTFLFYGS